MRINLINILFFILVVFSLAACQEKGPVEKAGERVDEIVDNVKDGDPLLHKKGTAEKAGEAVDQTVKDVTGAK